jgi:hypothetical protein
VQAQRGGRLIQLAIKPLPANKILPPPSVYVGPDWLLHLAVGPTPPAGWGTRSTTSHFSKAPRTREALGPWVLLTAARGGVGLPERARRAAILGQVSSPESGRGWRSVFG